LSHREQAKKWPHTIHDEFHVADKTMNDLKRFSSGHARLIEGETI
jgi:hypothetical protein